MSQATRKSKPARSEGIKLPETVRVRLFEAGILSLGLLVLVLLLSLLSFDPTDVAWSFRSSTPKVDNWMGPFGAWFALQPCLKFLF